MFIQTENTPNPDTLKFLPGREISPDRPRDFESIEAGEGSRLARALFRVDGVIRVFCGAEFISVTKDPTTEWQHLKPGVLGAIMDVLEADGPFFDESQDGENPQAVTGIAKEIIDIIDTRVRPAVAQDGGDIVFHSFDEETGVVQLHMRGACAGCPSSTMTLKSGIENLLQHYVPEVTAVEALEA